MSALLHGRTTPDRSDYERAGQSLPSNKIDFSEANDAFHANIDVSGYRKNDLEVYVQGNSRDQLWVKGKRVVEHKGQTRRVSERNSTRGFERCVDLPLSASSKRISDFG